MRSKNTDIMNQIKEFAENYYLEFSKSPSTSQIANAVGVARGTAYRYLVDMAERGMIDYDGEEIKTNVDKAIKKIFKVNTEHIISKRLPYWSKITELEYNQVKIRDAITRYGSCMPSKKNIYFSSRLIMLPEYVIDAIIVHELCHLKYKNHSKEFYELVSKYIPNYKDIDKWLKINGKIILF